MITSTHMITTSLPNNDDVNQDDFGVHMATIEQLIPHPENYNRHPQDELNAIKASMLRFGQRKTLVVQRCAGNPPRFLILAGHGTVEAVQQLREEYPHLAQRFSQLKIDIVPDDWTPAQAKGYMLADNEIAKKSAPDGMALATLLQEQLDLGEDLLSVGSSENELQDLLTTLGDEILQNNTDESFGDEDEDLLDIADENDDQTVETLDNLKFGKHVVPLTKEEYYALEERLKLYIADCGSSYGFVKALFK